MATPISPSDQTAPPPTTTTTTTTTVKHQRVLACVLCQQRKIKCDRTFPCANCVRGNIQCEQAIRQRRRRLPERELLARLRLYERLLRQHKIKFDPLHSPTADHPSPSDDGRDALPAGAESEDTLGDTKAHASIERAAVKTKSLYELGSCIASLQPVSPRDDDGNAGEDDVNDTGFLHDNDDVRHAVIQKAWNHMFQGQNNDHLLFGSPVGAVDLAAAHPSQVHIFRLWQVYLDNVNPLLKVTHTPTLQTRIIDAASDIANLSPTFEALMFSIYCVSLGTLSDEQCNTLLGAAKTELLRGYQFACQQALRSCGILRSSDRESLTALYLYLVSIRPGTDPASLSSLLSVAIRIAQRMGIHNESTYGECSALEAELRRRLWWSLIVFDNRICEMSDYKTASLAPTWDCKVPLNVNDFELQPEMKNPPATNTRPTEMLFAVVRSELADFVRHSAFHLNFTNPSLNTIALRPSSAPTDEANQLVALERTLQERYLAFSNPENALHFMTLWTMRGSLAKNRLLQHYYTQSSDIPVPPTDDQRNTGIAHALRMLECDTTLMTSPLTQPYRWLVHFHFPFPAYIHLLQDLRKRPVEAHAARAWAAMSDNYAVRMVDAKQDDRPFFVVFSRVVLQAWEAREKVGQPLETPPLVPPRIVEDIRNKVMQMKTSFGLGTAAAAGQSGGGLLGVNADGLEMPVQMDFAAPGTADGAGGRGTTGLDPWGYPDVSGLGAVDVGVNQFLLNSIDWNALHALGR
ncbi:C6 zinc finger domain protein [Aspergillus uvarum CBS 121591]|uniref:C6 zinc finger domain protein n=1 Tax=Aspergillus uvarum CBS 121591 TaxID=1448315 RepID=A0A319D5U8_9EURO|nr:C6 zinc finger domain protein [Aspergillus uvarum CBS 121591]PYH86353.1 C6 zinc finger domain protein [Aspergillus uvarum CBS 121591]